MTILLVYNFKYKACCDLLHTIIKNFEGRVCYRGSNTFGIKCDYSLVYKFFTTIYNDFKQQKTLTKTDSIEAFYVSSGSLDFNVVRLKKKNNVTLRKIDFEFLNAEYKLPLFL